jgi:sugar transferase (PEP-CTERM/EpsH1 system associated)
VNILFVLPYTPSVIRVRPYHFVRELAKRHEVSVLAAGSAHDAADLASLRQVCRRVETVPLRLTASLRSCASAALAGEPLQAGFCRSSELTRHLADLLASEHVDLVHLEHLRAAHLRGSIPANIPTVFDAVDCISLLQQRTLHASHSIRQRGLAALELHRTRAYEARLLRRFDRVVATSPDDALALSALAPGVEVSVVPNGVDLDHFQPLAGEPEPATIVLSGKMSYHANVSAALYFAREVLPLVRRARPDAQLRIVGSRPPRDLAQLARDPAVTVTGYVPDMREAIGRATVAVCPVTVKVGIQNKVLEAMALGVPVVCNRLGAEGLDAVDGRDFLVGDTSAELAARVIRLLNDRAQRNALGQRGRQFVENHHRWATAAERLEAIHRRAVARHATAELTVLNTG